MLISFNVKLVLDTKVQILLYGQLLAVINAMGIL